MNTTTVTDAAKSRSVVTLAELRNLPQARFPAVVEFVASGGLPPSAAKVTVSKIFHHAGDGGISLYDKNIYCFIEGTRYLYFDSRYTEFKIKKLAARIKLSQNSIASAITQKKHHLHIGSDPEFFVTNKKGEMIPSFEVFVSKETGANLYWDGYQAEISPPAVGCLQTHRSLIYNCLRSAAAKERKISLKNTWIVPVERLMNDNIKYVQFGCKPSFNVYPDEAERPPVQSFDPRTVPFRSAGGHLHFSLSKSQKEKIESIVRNLDAVLGVISVSMFQYWDTPTRREFYGRAGEYRTPAHGLEYRVLSNAWLCHPVAYMMVYEIARRVIGLALDPPEYKNLWNWKATEKEIRKCINECDVSLAQKILKRNEHMLGALLFSVNQSLHPFLSRVIFDGFHTVLKDPDYCNVDSWGAGIANIYNVPTAFNSASTSEDKYIG